jgi:hypothetical protein
MIARSPLALVAACFFAASCNTDASMTKDLVGVWTWKPRESLPKEKIADKGFPTPDLEAVRLDADGRCVVVQTVPGYDTDVAGRPFHVPDLWLEYQGSWSVGKGELRIESAGTWGAKHDASGWHPETVAYAGGFNRVFQITEHGSNQLRLHTLAIGDYDRHLRRSSTLPQRPPLASGGSK